MRSIGPGLRIWTAALSATAGLSVLFGRSDQSDEGTRVVIGREKTDRFESLDGESDSLRSETFRVTCHSDESNAKAHELADAIAGALEEYGEGPMGDHRYAEAIYLDDERGEFEPDEFGEETGNFAAEVLVTIQHSPQD